MNYIVSCSIISCIIITVVLGGIIIFRKINKYIFKLKNYVQVAQDDFYYTECQSVAIINAILKINYNIESHLSKLKNILKTSPSKINQYEFLEQIKKMEQDCNNINVIMNIDPKMCYENVDIRDEIQCLIDDVSYINNKVKLNIQKGMETKFIFDNKKLMSALRIVILKSMENEFDKNIDINVSCIERINSKSKIVITIKNVNLFNEDNKNSEQDIANFFDMKTIDPKYNTYLQNVNDSDLLILRQNLFYLSAKIRFSYNNDEITNSKSQNIDIFLLLENQRQKRKYFKALIVGDNETIVKMNQEILKRLKIDSDIVLSEKECIKIINQNYENYDIIFIDNQILEKNETELLQKLKKCNDLDLPVVIVTDDNKMNSYFKEHWGFNNYIVKPLTEKITKKIIKDQLESND